MNIYIICQVRNVNGAILDDVASYVSALESDGHSVHYPPRDVDQDDPTGAMICEAHREAMENADRVDVFWDSESFGSHFDFGMAYALHKPIKLVKCYDTEEISGKSYLKVLKALDESIKKS